MPLFQSISFVLALMLTAGIAAGEPQSRSTTQPAARGSVPVRHPPSAGEERWMAYTMLLAKTFGFSSYQKTRVLQFAQQSGIGACIEESDSYFQRGLAPPDLLSSSPITQCDWNAQTFREWVFSLVTPEQKAAHSASYTDFSREIAGNRLVLQRRSQR